MWASKQVQSAFDDCQLLLVMVCWTPFARAASTNTQNGFFTFLTSNFPSLVVLLHTSYFDLVLFENFLLENENMPKTTPNVLAPSRRKKKTIPLPGGAELVKLAMSTNSGSVQPTGFRSATLSRLQWITFVLRKTLFDYIKSCGSQIRWKISEVAFLGLRYSPK